MGGIGIDLLDGGAGNDSIDGGDGFDSYSAAAAAAAFSYTVGAGILTTSLGTDTLVAIEMVLGSAFADTMTGGITDDHVNGGGGADILTGGDGLDTLDYSNSAAAVVVDLFNGTSSGGDAAGDVFTGFENIAGSTLGDSLVGNDFNNVITGGAGADTISGGLGTDTADYSGSAAGVLVNLSSGFGFGGDAQGDIIDGIQNLIGSEFNDTLTGDDNINVLTGGLGADFLNGGLNTDTMLGGAGDDVYVVDNAADLVTEAAASGIDLVTADLNWTLGDNLENLTFTGNFDLTGIGNAAANVLTGNSGTLGSIGARGYNVLQGLGGNDTLIGNGGNDTLDGGIGDDSMNGGLGNDVYIIDSALDLAVEITGQGVDTIQTTLNATLGTFFENLTLTGLTNAIGIGNDFTNIMEGNDGNNALFGLIGNDTMAGGLGNDTLDGGVGIDSMTGGVGDDTYIVDIATDRTIEISNGGIDTVQTSVTVTLVGEVENLLMTSVAVINGTGNASANTMTGNTAANALYGGIAADTLFGGAGTANDTLDGGTSADNLTGGAGDELYFIDNVGDVVVELIGAGTDTVSVTADWTMSTDIETLVMTGTTALTATGNALANTMTGNTGSNTINGAAGADTLNGGTGTDNDTLDGGTGDDSMTGGGGDDSYVIDAAGDVLVEAAAAGTDTVQSTISHTLNTNFERLTLLGTLALNGTGNAAANVLTGNTGSNALSGLDANDTLYGGDGADTLDGGSGVDSQIGGLGDDLYVVDNTLDKVNEATAGAGLDTVQSSVTYTTGSFIENLTLTGAANINATGNALDNVLTGNAGSNLLSAVSGNDTLFGGTGSDTLDGGTGDDAMTGGGGSDVLRVDSLADTVFESAGGGNDTVESTVTWILADNFEHLTLTGSDAVSGTGNAGGNAVTGNAGANLLSGLGGTDIIAGGAGNDTLDGGTGNDAMAGGAGNDIYLMDTVGDSVTEALNEGTDQVLSSVTYILGANIENLDLTGINSIGGTGNTLANKINGNDGDNNISASDGNDTVTGGLGDDTLDGGVGVDSLTGGLGSDIYVVDAATDKTIEGANGGTDTVQSFVTFTTAVNVENLTLLGTANVNAIGNVLDNVLTGNSGNNLVSGADGFDTLFGGDGNDTLDGGDNFDEMTGGLGNDTFVVNLADDLVFEAASGGTDLVQTSVDWTLATNFENLTLSGNGLVAGTGNSVANVISGNTGANALSGLAGNDTITGGAGNDTQTGGDGADQFIFVSTTSGNDVIVDFNNLDGQGAEGDLLVFTGLQVGVFDYVGAGAFTGGANNSEARVVGNQLQIDTDGNGTANIKILMTGLTSATQLTDSDFLWN